MVAEKKDYLSKSDQKDLKIELIRVMRSLKKMLMMMKMKKMRDVEKGQVKAMVLEFGIFLILRLIRN